MLPLCRSFVVNKFVILKFHNYNQYCNPEFIFEPHPLGLNKVTLEMEGQTNLHFFVNGKEVCIFSQLDLYLTYISIRLLRKTLILK